MNPAKFIAILGGTPNLNASAAPSSVSGTGSGSGSTSITTASTSVTPSGGVPPYTYAWTVLTGSFTINSATASTTTFTKSISPGSASGSARCTVTDAIGQTAHADVATSFSNTYVAPNPPTWNVANGTNMGTFPRGGSTQLIDLYATCTNASGKVIYSVGSDFPYPGGQFGPEFSWPTGVQTPGGTGHLQGAASSGCTPGDYSAAITAVNPSDLSSSSISITVTVT